MTPTRILHGAPNSLSKTFLTGHLPRTENFTSHNVATADLQINF